MAVSYSNVTELGLLSQQYPPALLPKPGRENVRLQKLLKKTEKKNKKKAAPETAKTPVPFRSNLSPVNEASPDLEHSDHSTPPKTPEAPFYTQHPRFVVRPVYRHVTSPYPHHREYNKGIARFSPQLYAAPAPTFPQHVAPLYKFTPTEPSPVPGPVSHAVAPTMPMPTSSVPEVKTTAAVEAAPLLCAPVAPVTITPAATQSTLRLVPVVIHRKSPSPRFKATEATLKAPRPMFDVPQIWIYTASKSPVHDYAGKTSIAGPVPWSKTTLPEIQRAATSTSEVKNSLTSTLEVKTGAMFETYQNTMQTSEVIRSTTQTLENSRSLTPTSAIKRGLASTPEIQRSVTPTSEIKRAKMPSHEFLTPRTSSGRPRTPSYHVSRAITPVFEISRPNPLLFAVSPIMGEAQRSKTPTLGSNAAGLSLSGSQNLTTSEFEPSKSLSTIEIIQNGELILTETSTAERPLENTSKPEVPQQELQIVECKRPKTAIAPLGNEQPKTPTNVPPEPSAPLIGYQRPKTPTIIFPKPTAASCGQQHPKIPVDEEPKPITSEIDYQRPQPPAVGYQRPQPPAGYQRPKTPTSGVSSGFQRPKTPTYVAPKPSHTYYGLTPAEYVAHGGIQSYSPSFGISRSKTPTLVDTKTQTEVCYLSHQEASSKELKQMISIDAIGSTTTDVQIPLPTIVVTEALEVSEPSVSTPVTSKIPIPTAESPKLKTMAHPRPWAKSPTHEVMKTQDESLVKTPTDGESKKPTLETQHPWQDASKSAPPVSKTEFPVAVLAQQKELKESTEPKTPTETTVEAKPEGTKPATSPTLAKVSASENLVTAGQSPAKSNNNQEAIVGKAVLAQTTSKAEHDKEGKVSVPAAEHVLKVIQKPKGMKSKLSGWSRLKKHMVVEEEPSLCLESDLKQETAKGTEQQGGEAKKDEKVSMKDKVAAVMVDNAPKAAKKWDSLLFDMFSTKEKIMQVIEASRSEEEKKEQPKDSPKEIPSFAYRLPVLLFSPKFDAKRLREAASRPLTKISTVFEMGLIGRKNKDEEPKDFNRTARGFICL